jgi:archaellum biogenesis protein FlaJ (TadC family)
MRGEKPSYRSFALRCAALSGVISLAVNLVLTFTVMGLLYLPIGMAVALGTGPLLYLIL